MKIFIDSADLDEIKQGYLWGVADGVTTNPSLLKMHSMHCLQLFAPKVLPGHQSIPIFPIGIGQTGTVPWCPCP